MYGIYFMFFFFKQKTAYEMRISDWSSDVCSSDLLDGDNGDDVLYGDEQAATGTVMVALDIQAALADRDGSETLSVAVSGIPMGAILSAGTQIAAGIWQLAPEDLSDLTLSVTAGTPSFQLAVEATATETANEDKATRLIHQKEDNRRETG